MSNLINDVWTIFLNTKFIQVIFGENRYKLILEGLKFALGVTFIATIIGLALGIILAIFKLSNEIIEETSLRKLKKMNPFYYFASIYIDLIRGTPLMVQLMLISNFIVIGKLKDTPTLVVAGIGIGLNSSAYVAEIIRSGIKSLDKGQMEAARALGLPYLKAMRLVILPQAFKNMIPTFVNEFIVLIKETSVVGCIGGLDLFKSAEKITYLTYDGISPFIAIALVYLMLTSIFTGFMRIVERSLDKSDKS